MIFTFCKLIRLLYFRLHVFPRYVDVRPFMNLFMLREQNVAIVLKGLKVTVYQ